MTPKILHLIGYAFSRAGIDPGCSEGPWVLQRSPYLPTLKQHDIDYKWDDVIAFASAPELSLAQDVSLHCQTLAVNIKNAISAKHFFAVIGGDHTSAIGTWYGAAATLSGDLGLIWLDAHMDSHTPETSESGRLHGMPLACLLGAGYPELTTTFSATPAIKPENLCLIGVRSFEAGEAAFLKKLGVRIYYMDEIKQRGLSTILAEAKTLVSARTVAFGISLDLDCIDPSQAPGVDAVAPDGIEADELCAALTQFADEEKLLGIEIAEFNPHRDRDHLTEQRIIQLLACTVGNNS